LSLSLALHGFHVEGRHVDELSVVRRQWAEGDSPYGRLADDNDKRTAATGDKNSGKAAAALVSSAGIASIPGGRCACQRGQAW